MNNIVARFLTAAAVAFLLGVSSMAFAAQIDLSPKGEVRDGFEYQAVAISQSDKVLGAVGSAGDYLDHLVVVVATAATAQVQIKDGGGSAITVLPSSPGGGVGTYNIDLKLKSTSGAWKITTLAGATVVAVGRFTD